MSVETLSSFMTKILMSERLKNITPFSAFVFSEGSFAEQCNVDRWSPGSTYTTHGHTFSSPFNRFERGGFGQIIEIEGTWLSVLPGWIDDKRVLFIHPTSISVNYETVKKEITNKFPDIKWMEADQNFLNNFNR